MKYSKEQIEQLNESFNEIEIIYNERFQNKYPTINFVKKRANEFFRHGYWRRLQTLKHCIDSIFRIYPPEREEILSDEERLDLEVYIQAFVFNTFGCIDNLAWIINCEKTLELPFTQVSLFNPKVQKFFSPEFNKYLNEVDEIRIDCFRNWYDTYCKNFRHALAHRIPLYVPPCGVIDDKRYSEIEIERWNALLSKDFDKVDELDEEGQSLEHILPLFVHSFEEESPKVPIHPQIIVDFKTIIELSDKFFDELT